MRKTLTAGFLVMAAAAAVVLPAGVASASTSPRDWVATDTFYSLKGECEYVGSEGIGNGGWTNFKCQKAEDGKYELFVDRVNQ